MRLFLIAALSTLLFAAAPTRAEDSTLPSAALQEALIKTSMLTLNDANLTKNYTVLYAQLAKAWRDETSADKLKEIFKPFADAQINYAMIVAMPPVTEAVKVDDGGALRISGYFKTEPNRVHYDLAFVQSEGTWKPIKLSINIRAP